MRTHLVGIANSIQGSVNASLTAARVLQVYHPHYVLHKFAKCEVGKRGAAELRGIHTACIAGMRAAVNAQESNYAVIPNVTNWQQANFIRDNGVLIHIVGAEGTRGTVSIVVGQDVIIQSSPCYARFAVTLQDIFKTPAACKHIVRPFVEYP